MNIAVCVKQALYTGVSIEIDAAAGSARQKEPAPVYFVNPPDRCAIEEARLITTSNGGSVTALSLGPARAAEAIYYCLAAGADRGVHLFDDDPDTSSALVVVSSLGTVIGRLNCDLILCGTKSSDEGTGQIPQMLAELLGLPQITGAIKLEIKGDQKRARVVRKLERGNREVVECPLPAVIAVDPLINEPGYVSRHLCSLARRNINNAYELNLDVVNQARAGHPSSHTSRIAPSRPRLKNIVAPDANLSAMDRLSFLMKGGVTEKKCGILQGPVAKLVDHLVDLLKKEGFITHEP